MIYVSTGGFSNKTAYESACDLFDANIFSEKYHRPS